MTHITMNRPAPVTMPRFAPIAAEWFSQLLEVLHLARRVHSARRERNTRITEANSLRRYATAMMTTDPRVAADLFAAADRHDRDM
jgi:hypothetical protein